MLRSASSDQHLPSLVDLKLYRRMKRGRPAVDAQPVVNDPVWQLNCKADGNLRSRACKVHATM